MKNKALVKGSIVNAYLLRKASIFFSHYFESGVSTRNRKVPQNDDGGDKQSDDDDNETLDIFSYPGRHYGKLKIKMFSNEEFIVAHSYILLNEDRIKL